MAKVIIRLPGQFSRWLLKAVGALLTLIFALFTYATGQSPQQSAGKGTSVYYTKAFFKTSSLLDTLDSIPYLISVPMYGGISVISTRTLTFKGVIRSERQNLPLNNISVELENSNLLISDTINSAQDGSFSFSEQVPEKINDTTTWILKARDISGIYKEKDTLISVNSSDIAGQIQIELHLDQLATGITLDNHAVSNETPAMTARYNRNGLVDIRYSVPAGVTPRLSLYNALGEFVREFTGIARTPGEHTLTVSCSCLSTGAYFLKLHGGDFAAVTRFSVTR